MNSYDARQRKDDDRWDYTCQNDGHTHPVGYCAGWPGDRRGTTPIFSDEAWSYFLEKLKPFKEHYHTDGHATAEEACECYRRYLLDNRLEFRAHGVAHYPCRVCGALTNCHAEVDFQMFHLCDEHRNKEEVEKLFPKVGQSWSSY